MPDYILGMNAALYYGAADGDLGTLVEATNVMDVTLNLESGEADVTTRGNSGWRALVATLRQASIEFEMKWLPADAAFAAIRDAYLNSTVIELAALDQVRETSGAEGIKGNFSIVNFTRSEPLEEGIKVSVTARLSKFNEWVEVA
jgi:hypothetical protein